MLDGEDPDPTSPYDDKNSIGFGCSTSPTPPALTWLVLLSGILAVRRRGEA